MANSYGRTSVVKLIAMVALWIPLIFVFIAFRNYSAAHPDAPQAPAPAQVVDAPKKSIETLREMAAAESPSAETARKRAIDALTKSGYLYRFDADSNGVLATAVVLPAWYQMPLEKKEEMGFVLMMHVLKAAPNSKADRVRFVDSRTMERVASYEPGIGLHLYSEK